MADSVIQHAFHAGEWAPALYARTDLAKYKSAAALLENFFVDYRGGASSRPGTRYLLQAYKSATAVRLIPFQAGFTTGYAMEFGDFYIRFYFNGAPVLESSFAITAEAGSTLTVPGHNYAIGNWIYAAGTTSKYLIITVVAGNVLTVTDLFGDPIVASGFVAGTTARVYTISSPYAAGNLALLKFAQNVTNMVITHASYVPYILTLITATNWTLIPIVFGSTVPAPVATVATTLAVGTVNYSYIVTAVDANGQESPPSTPATLVNKTDLRTVAGTNRISWAAIPGAVSYNVYKAILSYTNVVATGAAHGYIGNCTGVAFDDSNVEADYTQTPPIPQNPFQGAGVLSATVTAPGAGYATVPTATFAAAPSGGATATGSPYLGVTSAAVTNGRANYSVGDICFFANGVALTVATVNGAGAVLTVTVSNPGALFSGAIPVNPVQADSHTGTAGPDIICNLTWGVVGINISSPGAGYLAAPAITFSAGAAAATAVLGAASAGNPSVPAYFQQRLGLMGPSGSPQQFNFSQPGLYFDYNISNPIKDDDAISGTLVSGVLNAIKSAVAMPAGLLVFGDRLSWLINGGSAGSNITPISLVANAQSYNGASDVPPIVANYDVLYVQAKGSIVRDAAYNFYTNVFTGTDISILSSHLFYGYEVLEWAWAEEPFKVVWAIRDDGTMLTLTFLKEQELIGWSHSVTDGEFKSVCVVTEAVTDGNVDAVYTVVERTINGDTVKYIERFAERIFPNGVADAWCVDSGLQYDGAPATNFTGGEHLAGETVTGLADGLVITPFVMPANGSFTLAAASKVTVGLPFTCDLETMRLDTGEPTIQGKRKAIGGVTARVADTLGLKIGTDSSNLVTMKDLVIGNVGSASNEVVTGLVTGDARTIINPSWDVQGQYLIRQDQPFPCTILGVIPEIEIGDTGSKRKP